MLSPRNGAAGGVIGGLIIVAGGEGNQASPSGVFSATEAYDAATDSWKSLEPMPRPRHGFQGLASVGGALYFPGGDAHEGGADVTNQFDVYVPPSMTPARR
jgi:N-acetylneuraminic acid mutarotase